MTAVKTGEKEMDLKANLSIGDEGEVGEDWHKEDLRMGKEGPTDATVAVGNHADEEAWQDFCGVIVKALPASIPAIECLHSSPAPGL